MCVICYRGSGDTSVEASSVEKPIKPLSTIEQAMQATLASIELPPPPKATTHAKSAEKPVSESR